MVHLRRFSCRQTVRRSGISLAILVASLIPALAGPEGNSPYLTEGSPAEPTRAWANWCDRAPDECSLDPLESRVVVLDAGLSDLLVSVNLEVNRRIRAVTDEEHWGVADRWDYPTDGVGDCEDLQIEKRRLLAEAGIPRAAMRIAMVINPEGEGHAVLVVRTDRGDMVLDNRVNAVKPWFRTGYTWVKWESPGTSHWVSLGGFATPPVTAAKD